MKRKIFLLTLVILAGLFSGPQLSGTADSPGIPVQIKRLYHDIDFLASLDPPRNFQNMNSLNRAADYIFKAFQKSGCRVEFQECPVKKRKYRNVIASFAVNKRDRIVIGAHYDVCRSQPGADDNGSGVAAVLELARLINELKPALKHRVDLVAYTLEEPPYFRSEFMGSAVHAASLAREKARVKLMMSLDMIGFFAADEKNDSRAPSSLVTFKDPTNATAVVGITTQESVVRQIREIMAAAVNIEMISVVATAQTRGIDFSDHLNFWNEGFPAVMVTNFFTSANPHYHGPGDTIDTLDFRKLAGVIRAAYKVIVDLN